jgi:hypothetical protein
MVDLLDVGHKRGDVHAAKTGYLLAREHVYYAWLCPRGFNVQRGEARVRIRAAQHRDVEQVRDFDVFGILPGAGQ